MKLSCPLWIRHLILVHVNYDFSDRQTNVSVVYRNKKKTYNVRYVYFWVTSYLFNERWNVVEKLFT